MATIDEVFAKMEADEAYNEAHDIIYIDPVKRKLHVPGTELILGVVNDCCAERKYFSMPAVVGNDIKVTDCVVHVNYINAAGKLGCFCVCDTRSDGDNVLFSWEISKKVTKQAGEVNFIVCVCKENADGEVLKEWHTTLATGTVLEGIDASTLSDDDIDTDSNLDNPELTTSAKLGTAILGQLILGRE